MTKDDLLHNSITAPVTQANIQAHAEIEEQIRQFEKNGGKIRVLQPHECAEYESMTAKQLSEHRYNACAPTSKRRQK